MSAEQLIEFVNRTIEMRYSGNNVPQFVSAHREKFEEIIGYFSTWSPRTWDKLIICVSCDAPPKTLVGTEISAMYSRTQDSRVFQMMAIWREDEQKFTTHS